MGSAVLTFLLMHGEGVHRLKAGSPKRTEVVVRLADPDYDPLTLIVTPKVVPQRPPIAVAAPRGLTR